MDLATILTDQDGLITREQALAAGMTDSAIRHATRPGGAWQRLVPGLYATVTGPLTPRQRLQAALLHAGPDSMISGAHACQAHGLRYVPEVPRPLVLASQECRSATNRLAVVRRALVLPTPRQVAGLRVAPVERAVLDTVRRSGAAPEVRLSLQDTRALVCESVQRRLTTPARLAAELAAAPPNGTRLARRAVDDVMAGCWSAPECEVRDLVRRSRVLPEPRWNTPLPGLSAVVPDGWWDEARLVLEVDSAEHHDFGTGPEQTKRRHGRMVAAGWTVMPIAPVRIRREPATLLLEIESAYRLGVSRVGMTPRHAS